MSVVLLVLQGVFLLVAGVIVAGLAWFFGVALPRAGDRFRRYCGLGGKR